MKLYLASLKVVQSGGAGYVEGEPSPYQSDKGVNSNKNGDDSNKNSTKNSGHHTPATGNPMLINTSDQTTLPLRHSPLAVNRPSTLSAAISASRANSPTHSQHGVSESVVTCLFVVIVARIGLCRLCRYRCCCRCCYRCCRYLCCVPYLIPTPSLSHPPNLPIMYRGRARPTNLSMKPLP